MIIFLKFYIVCKQWFIPLCRRYGEEFFEWSCWQNFAFTQSWSILILFSAFNADLHLISLVLVWYNGRLNTELKQYTCYIFRSFVLCLHVYIYIPDAKCWISFVTALFHLEYCKDNIQLFCILCKIFVDNLLRNLPVLQILTNFFLHWDAFYADRTQFFCTYILHQTDTLIYAVCSILRIISFIRICRRHPHLLRLHGMI